MHRYGLLVLAGVLAAAGIVALIVGPSSLAVAPLVCAVLAGVVGRLRFADRLAVSR